VVQSTQRYSPALERVDLLDVLDECATELLARTRRKRKSLHLEVPEDLPRVHADPSLLRTVLANLLDNAARHAPRSAIRVTAREEGERVAITIADNGPGMDPQSRLRAFDPFFRAGESREGLGLGLFIVRAILEAHGSEANLESVPGEGTAITFSLPSVTPR